MGKTPYGGRAFFSAHYEFMIPQAFWFCENQNLRGNEMDRPES